MKPEKFINIVEHRLDSCETTLSSKAVEYSKDNDRLHNFKTAARIKGCTQIEALYGMWLKHIVSIQYIIENAANFNFPSYKLIADKFNDNINYTLLAEGILVEEREAQGTSKYIIGGSLDLEELMHE